MSPQNYTSALEDFRNERRRAALEEIVAYLTGRSADLFSYDQVSRMLKASGSEPRGLREIPLDAIVGSVGRYTDFTRSFLPRLDSDKERWARIEVAAADLAGLPPIDVYQIGQAYFVSDGNHRVSVARRLGATHILAHVTEVHTKVPLSPEDQPDDLIVKAEYAEFLEHTRLDELRPKADLSVTIPGQYPALEEQIRIYQYFIGLGRKREIPYPEAAAEWYDAVYLPVARAIREQNILRDLPGRTETDLYAWILEHRAALQKELGWPIRPVAAAADLAERFSTRPRRVARRVSARLLSVVRPEELADGPAPGEWRRRQWAERRADRLFTDLLVPVSGQEPGWQALDQAMEIARREGGRLFGLHVVASKAQRESLKAQAVQAEFNQRCRAAGVPGELAVEVGAVARKICQRSRWADLIVVNLAYPPAPRPVARLQSGFRALIRRCPRPILAVPRASSHLDRALLAYDDSPKAKEALFVATYLAGRWNIPLAVVTVLEDNRATSQASAHAREYLEMHGIQATYVEASGPVAEGILWAAQEHASDWIIMGGYGFTPVLEVVLGSAVDRVLRESRQPILVCR